MDFIDRDYIKKVIGWIFLFFLFAILVGAFAWTPGMAFLALLKIIGIIFGGILAVTLFAVFVFIAIGLISGEI